MNMNSGRLLVVNTNWEKLTFRPHKLDKGDVTFIVFHDARICCWNSIINWALTLCLWLSQTRTPSYLMTLYFSRCAEVTAAVVLCCHATENSSYFPCNFEVHSAAVITRTETIGVIGTPQSKWPFPQTVYWHHAMGGAAGGGDHVRVLEKWIHLHLFRILLECVWIRLWSLVYSQFRHKLINWNTNSE